MLIRSFWAKGYRSLCDVKIENLGPFNVFYGPNGAGKSNVLSAMRTLFRLLELRSSPGLEFRKLNQRWVYDQDDEGSASRSPLNPDDRSHLTQGPEMMLGATIVWDRNRGVAKQRSALTVEFFVEWDTRTMRITRLESAGFDLVTHKALSGESRGQSATMGGLAAARARSEQIHLIANRLRLGVVKTDDDLRQALRRFVHEMAHLGMTLVDASRFALPETLSDRPRDIDWLLARGRLKEAFYRADHHPDGVVRKRYKQLQELLQGPPLNRPPFAIIVDPETGRIDLRERVPDSPSEVAEVPLDLAGLGVVQVYGIIGSILLQPARAVGIEEPEAHLHAPTTGKDLRVLLERMVNEGYIDQLFIATHSNLFDLDSTGYFDVSREEGKGTIVVREKDLTKIDKDHLYEPGPAKHALQRSLEYLDDDEVVFRRNDTDEPVTAKQMIEMLQRDDELAFEFLDDVHEAAVRAVRVKSKRGTPAK